MRTRSFADKLLSTLRDIREDFKGGQTSNCAYEDWNELSEDAEYEGKKVSLNKPFRTPGAERKFGVYVKNDKGNVVMVRFGDPNMEIKRDDPDRRSNYRARHGCDNPGPKWKANYWSCRMWAKKSVSAIIDEATHVERRGTATGRHQDYALVVDGVMVGRVKTATEGTGGIGMRTSIASWKISKGYWTAGTTYKTKDDAERALIDRAKKEGLLESLGHEGSSMCPTCHSYDIVHQEMEDGQFFNICRKCSKRWETDEVAR